ncbi:hypothetical protein [Stackebrandtia soli]|uniref:hypothetical protein n=1 Tax=Stackebrandtia soli TaxID=1892856 RepID=UPI0039ED4F95
MQRDDVAAPVIGEDGAGDRQAGRVAEDEFTSPQHVCTAPAHERVEFAVTGKSDGVDAGRNTFGEGVENDGVTPSAPCRSGGRRKRTIVGSLSRRFG